MLLYSHRNLAMATDLVIANTVGAMSLANKQTSFCFGKNGSHLHKVVVCCGLHHISLLSTCHMVQAALLAFLHPLMHLPVFSVLCDALYFLFQLNSALGHSLGLGITPQHVTTNPSSSVICLVWTFYCSLLTTPLFSYFCCFLSLCAQTLCTLVSCNHCHVHRPCSKGIYSSTCMLPSSHLDLLSSQAR